MTRAGKPTNSEQTACFKTVHAIRGTAQAPSGAQTTHPHAGRVRAQPLTKRKPIGGYKPISLIEFDTLDQVPSRMKALGIKTSGSKSL